MPSNADKLTNLVVDYFYLDEGPNFDVSFSDLDISSIDVVAFFKLVNNEFGLGLEVDEYKQFETLSDLQSFIDSQAG